MKHTIKYFAAALAVLMLAVALAAGCGPEPVEVRIRKAVDNLEQAKSYDMVMEGSMTMKTMGLPVSTKISVEASYFADPMKMRMVTTTKAMGESMAIEQYIIAEGDAFIVYQKSEDGWTKQEMSMLFDLDALKQYSASKNLEFYVKSAANFEKVGTEKIDGVSTDVLEGFIAAAQMQDLMDDVLGMMNMQTLTEDPVVAELVRAMFGNMQDVPLKLWIDPRTYMPVQYYMDMTETMNAMMGVVFGMMPQGELDGFSLEVTNYTMTTRITNVNKATDFTLPAAALAL